jgi:regulator of sigma E protease
MHILKIILICLEVLVLFNLLIFAHELGHFLAARWRGLKVERFAIWFGKPIWTATINGVEYCLGFVPFGGYVRLPQMEVQTIEALEGKSDTPPEEIAPAPVLDKIIVALAGPLFSFLMAVVCAGVVWLVGRPLGEAETTTTIGYVEKDGPAAKAGLQPGDKILEIDGKPVVKFGGFGDSVTWHVVRSEGATVPVKVERGGQILTFETVPVKEPTKAWQRKSLRQIKIAPAQSAIVAEVTPAGPAARAGLKPGDEILSVNGVRLHHYAGLSDYVETHPGEALTLKYVREGRQAELSVKPEVPLSPPGDKPRIGIVWDPTGKYVLAHPGVAEQVGASVNAMISTFAALFSPKSDIKPQHLGGAVKILTIYYMLFESEQGWRLALWFSVLLNVNLAVLNLLPLPVLDGGHIVLALLEWVRRKPFKAATIKFVYTGFFAVLVGYMLYITFFDVQELPWRGTKEPPVMKFQPQPEPAK